MQFAILSQSANNEKCVQYRQHLHFIIIVNATMAEPLHAFVIWAVTQQRSVIRCAAIVNGVATPKEDITAGWLAGYWLAG